MSKDPPKKKRSLVTIRELEFDDLSAVFHLGEKLFTSREAPNLYRTWDEHEVINLYQDDQEICLVAEAENRLVGFALSTTVSKSRSAWKYGYLVWMGVDPGWQRQGIATRLFSHLRIAMTTAGVRMLLVDTEVENEPALNFFKKAGFGNPDNHVYLTLNLTSDGRLSSSKVENGPMGADGQVREKADG